MLTNKKQCLIYLISLSAGLGCFDWQQQAQGKSTDAWKVPRRLTVDQVVIERTPSKANPANTWVYKETVGKTGANLHTASIAAPERLKFDAPFQGGSTVTMTLRKRDESTTVSLRVSKGQFTGKFQGGKVRIGFDNKPSALYTFTAASDGSTDIIFLDSVQAIIAKLKAARKMVIDISFYGQGVRRVTFRTEGLAWK